MKYDWLFVGAGGFVGSVSRYLIYIWFMNRNLTSFPWATMLVNILGCFAIGLMSGFVERTVPDHRLLFLAGSVGFLGGFTTFSAFGLDTLQLFKNQGFPIALANVVASVFIGVLAVWIGRSLTLSL